MKNQLVLPLAQEFNQAQFENFYAEQQPEILYHLQRMLAEDTTQCVQHAASATPEQGEKIIYLAGTAATGKTHLLHAACDVIQKQHGNAIYVPCQMLLEGGRSYRAYLEGLAQSHLICLDDVHCLLGDGIWEEALFHLYNQVKASNCLLLLSSKELPAHLDCVLPDLKSRLSWGLVLQLQALNDAQKAQALQLWSQSLSLILSEQVIDYIMRRSSRDMRQLMEYLRKLDAAAWQANRRITLAFVKQVLEDEVVV